MPLGEQALTNSPLTLLLRSMYHINHAGQGDISKLKQFSNKDAPFKKYNNITLFCDAFFVPAANLENVLQMSVQIIN